MQLDIPADANGPWRLNIPRGVLAFASADRSNEPPLIIDRVALRLRIDPAKRIFEIEQGDLSGTAGGLALSGGIDFSGPDPRLAVGIAGTRMTVSAFKRMWPALVQPRLRAWVVERVSGGMVERVVMATNAPFSTLMPGGPPVPDDGLSIEMVTSGNTLRLVDGIPPLRDADLTTRVIGRTATVAVGKATVDLPSGRKLDADARHCSRFRTRIPSPPRRARASAPRAPRTRRPSCSRSRGCAIPPMWRSIPRPRRARSWPASRSRSRSSAR